MTINGFCAGLSLRQPPGTKPGPVISKSSKPELAISKTTKPTDRALLNYAVNLHPRFWKQERSQPAPKSFQQFIQQSINEERAAALDRASRSGIILAPVNYVDAFWTVDRVKKLAQALSRPRQTENLQLEQWLCENWTKLGLQSKTMREVAAVVNRHVVGRTFTEAQVKGVVYRLELPTLRKPGPRSAWRVSSFKVQCDFELTDDEGLGRSRFAL